MLQLMCYCDNNWYPLRNCRSGASDPAWQLPFICPFDHVFIPLHFTDGAWRGQQAWQNDSSDWGPPASYREHSFLDNPRAAALRVGCPRPMLCHTFAQCMLQPKNASADGHAAPLRA